MGTMIKSLHSNEHKVVIDWLKKGRASQGMTMRELATKMKTPHSFIGKVEQGERRLDVVEYIRYCKALEVSPVEGLELLMANMDRD